MTNEQILKKAIEKAIENGLPTHLVESFGSDEWIEIITKNNAYFRIIFSHDFAKAFWGKV